MPELFSLLRDFHSKLGTNFHLLRMLSLLPIFRTSKLSPKLLRRSRQCVFRIDSSQLTEPLYSAYKPFHCCETVLVRVHHGILLAIDNRHCVMLLLLDLPLTLFIANFCSKDPDCTLILDTWHCTRLVPPLPYQPNTSCLNSWE